MWELEQKIDELLKEYMDSAGAIKVSAKELGLDRRCRHVYVSTDESWVAVEGSTKHVDYYGGFEYIDFQTKTTIGSYTFYTEGSRIENCLAFYIENYETEKTNNKER